MKTEQKKAGWCFWLLWIAASALGMFLAFILASPIPGRRATGMVAAMILGTGVGIMQWLCLRRHAPDERLWRLFRYETDTTKLDLCFIPLKR